MLSTYTQRTARSICTKYGFTFHQAISEFRKGKRWCSFGKHFWFNRRGYACKNACGPCRRALTTSGETMHRMTMLRHGTTPVWYAEQLKRQKFVCAICCRSEVATRNGRPRRLAIDHDHACCAGRDSCGKCIRGLLCNRCNFLLTMLEKFIAEGVQVGQVIGWSLLAVRYLRKYRVIKNG